MSGGPNFSGVAIGSAVVEDSLILFTTDDNYDRIYKVFNPLNNESNAILLFEGDLGFNESNKIQTLVSIETESVKKVYWVDGINQPRVINVAVDDTEIYKYTNTSFDFVQELSLNEIGFITKSFGSGLFKSGVIQYAATYYNKNGAESNIFWISGINEISFADRAGKPDEIVPTTFKIDISNLDDKFEFVRIYAIYRTSLDTTPEVRNVVDLKIPRNKSISYIDNGVAGSYLEPQVLLYVGGEELIPQCMSQKNNTLFLGNIKVDSSSLITPTLETNGDIIAIGVPSNNSQFEWVYKSKLLESKTNNNPMYPYTPFKSKIKHFKFDETYRFGVQGQYKSGKWSTPIWLGSDKKVDKRYRSYYDQNGISIDYVSGRYSIANNLRDWFTSIGFIKVRPVMVPLSMSERTIVAQGLVNNTLGVMSNRKSGLNSKPFAYPDYMLRPGGKHKTNYLSGYDGLYAHMDLLKLNNGYDQTLPEKDPNRFIEIMGNCDSWDYHDFEDNGYYARRDGFTEQI